MIDPNDPKGAHALERLATDKIGWLTSVTQAGQPQTMPVWFMWEDGEVLVYSQKDARRNDNIRANAKVSFHLNDDGVGGDVVSLDGEARFDSAAPAGKDHPAYLEKYGRWLDEYGWTPEYFSDHYPDAIRIRPTRVRLA